jgi:D-threonate/D-erythronate kinase
MAEKDEQSKNDHRISPHDISMIADDLAGACDTGFEFLDLVEQVTVVVDVDSLDKGADPSEGLTVYNTESRAIPIEAAYQKTRRASGLAGKGDRRFLIKKTDSAFRGHFGREIAAVMDELAIRLCCLAPAIPDFGRVTRNGIQYLDSLPIADSFYSQDPKNPVTESRVAAHAAVGNDRPVGLLDLKTLRGKQGKQKLAALITSGCQIVVTDSENRHDLEYAVNLFTNRPERVLFVGGQGLGNALATCCTPSAKREGWTKVPDGPALIVCGTLHPKSREQIAFLSRSHGLAPVLIHIDDSRADDRVAEAAALRLTTQMAGSGLGLLSTPENALFDPGRVEHVLAMTVQAVCDRIRLGGLLLTGGTTGYEACRRIGIRRLRLREKITWGAVMAQAPDMDGMAVLIKGGSLGEPEVMNQFVEIVRSLASRNRQRA